MKKFVINLQTASLLILGLITLCILGAEPSEMTSNGIERYQSSMDYWQPIILWGWVVTLAVFLTLTAIRYYLVINEGIKRFKDITE